MSRTDLASPCSQLFAVSGRVRGGWKRRAEHWPQRPGADECRRRSGAARDLPVAQHRSRSRRPIDCGRGRQGPAERRLLRRDRRRAVEDDRRRRDVGAGDRRPDHELVGRRRRGLGNAIRTSSSSARASRASAATSCRATASTSRPTPARRGRTSASATRRTSRRSASIRPTPTSSSSRRSASTACRTTSAACSRARTAARPGGSVLFRDNKTRRHRSLDRSQQSERDLRGAVGGVPQGIHDVERRPGQRPVQVHRRRRELDRDHAQPRHAGGHHRPHRRRRCPARTRIASTRSSRTRTAACSSSDDAGATWTLVNTNRNIRQRAFYYTHVTADPKNKDTVYVLNVGAFKSTDGGKTIPGWAAARTATLTTSGSIPTTRSTSASRTTAAARSRTRAAATWTRAGLSDRAVLPRDHDEASALPRVRRAAGRQHGVRAERTRGRGRQAAARWRWRRRGGGGGGGRGGAPAAPAIYSPGGAEPAYIAPDPKDPDVVLLRRQQRIVPRLHESPHGPEPRSPSVSAHVLRRAGERAPRARAVDVPDRLLAGRSQRPLHRDAARVEDDEQRTRLDADQRRPDAARSEDDRPLRRSDHRRHERARGLRDGLRAGAVEDRRQRDLGRIGRRHDSRHARRRQDVDERHAARTCRSSAASASSTRRRSTPGTAYAAVKRPLLGDQAPYLFRTHDFGKTWTKIVDGLKPNDYAHAIREDRKRRNLLYAGTQHGVYYSYDDGDTWHSLSLNLPDVQISDIWVEDTDLAICDARPVVLHPRRHRAAASVRPAIRGGAGHRARSRPRIAIRSYRTAQIQYWVKKPAQKRDDRGRRSEGHGRADVRERAGSRRRPIRAARWRGGGRRRRTRAAVAAGAVAVAAAPACR